MGGTKQLYVGGTFDYAKLRGSIKAIVCCYSNGHLGLQASAIMGYMSNNIEPITQSFGHLLHIGMGCNRVPQQKHVIKGR